MSYLVNLEYGKHYNIRWSKSFKPVLSNFREVTAHMAPQLLEEIQEWCVENVPNYTFEGSGYIIFDSEKDAVAFKLRW